MHEEHRTRVIKYLETHGDALVRFSTKTFISPFDKSSEFRRERIDALKKLRAQSKKLTLEKLILEILSLSRNFGTIYCTAKRIQCAAGKRRTAPDIWKIVANYRPEFTIFDVMHALYKITHTKANKVITSYCFHIIHQRTFRVDETKDSDIYDAATKDEFGLLFSAWKEI